MGGWEEEGDLVKKTTNEFLPNGVQSLREEAWSIKPECVVRMMTLFGVAGHMLSLKLS
jgi:hypothetical protein